MPRVRVGPPGAPLPPGARDRRAARPNEPGPSHRRTMARSDAFAGWAFPGQTSPLAQRRRRGDWRSGSAANESLNELGGLLPGSTIGDVPEGAPTVRGSRNRGPPAEASPGRLHQLPTTGLPSHSPWENVPDGREGRAANRRRSPHRPAAAGIGPLVPATPNHFGFNTGDRFRFSAWNCIANLIDVSVASCSVMQHVAVP